MDFLTDPFLIPANRFDGPVLVTGASGCIGAWAVAVLQRSGVPVIASDLNPDPARAALIMGEDAARALSWTALDVTDGAAVADLISGRDVHAIIHLAGLQVPFCAANPALGARVNVEGTINILEAARGAGVRRVCYASSIASLSFPPGGGYKETLYGAYKLANENTAFVYWQDWQVPSVGLRPNVVYGVARDQGMSSLNTAGIQAAALGQAFEIPYTGPYSWLYAGEAAAAFIAAVSADGAGAHVFNLNGRCETIENGLSILKGLDSASQTTAAGAPFPFPADLDDAPLRAHVAPYPSVPVDAGIADTYRAFSTLHAEGRLPPLPG